MAMIGTVGAINRYPVKSLQGESLDEAELEIGRLVGDRSWGIVDLATGHVLTAKRVDELLGASAVLTENVPTITLPDGTSLSGPGQEADRSLSEWLGREVALRPAGEASTSFRMSFNVDEPDVDEFEWSTPPGSFVDVAPVHLITSASLAAAAANAPGSNLSVHRFRPTLVVDTGDAAGFVEDDWVGATLSIGDAVIEVTMPTVRCSMPTKEQPGHGLARDLEVFKSIASQHKQNLGLYANVTNPGTVRIGDVVALS